MRAIIYFILLVFLQSKGITQNSLQNDFETFLTFFNNSSSDEELFKVRPNEIPIDIAKKIVGTEIINENVVSIYSVFIQKKGIYINIILELTYPEGGNTSSFYILSFSITGEVKKSQMICCNSLDSDGGAACNMRIINDSILEAKVEEKMINDGGAENILSTKYYYTLINKNEFKEIKLSEPSIGRLYPQASYRILQDFELKKMSKTELQLMRNEIFADHGYIFKNKKWKEYFEKEKWYNPNNENVTNCLTIIEKINIEKILKITPLSRTSSSVSE